MMKAEGSEKRADAKHVLRECVRNDPVESLQLEVEEVRTHV